MMVELVRLLVTLSLTAIGYRVASGGEPTTQLLGATLGAGVGYVLGGVLGRLFRSRLDDVPKVVAPRSTGPELFFGSFGLIVGLIVGAVAAVPLLLYLPPEVGLPIAILVLIVTATVGIRLFASRADDLLAFTGLRRRYPLTPRSVDEPGYLIDTSAAIDGRILELTRARLLSGRLLFTTFVLDELQGLADSPDRDRRRKGRRGLDVLEALQDVPGCEVALIEDSVPGVSEVDAKLLAVAVQSGATLVTTDSNLAKVAELRGIEVINPQALSEAMKPPVGTGDRIEVTISRQGSEPGQGVGYLDDGTMLVVEQAADRIGEELLVEVTATTRTAVGRMLFGRPA